jgi:hypothetical protein
MPMITVIKRDINLTPEYFITLDKVLTNPDLCFFSLVDTTSTSDPIESYLHKLEKKGQGE